MFNDEFSLKHVLIHVHEEEFAINTVDDEIHISAKAPTPSTKTQ